MTMYVDAGKQSNILICKNVNAKTIRTTKDPLFSYSLLEAVLGIKLEMDRKAKKNPLDRFDLSHTRRSAWWTVRTCR